MANIDYINIMKDFTGSEEESKEILVNVRNMSYIVRIPRDTAPEDVSYYKNILSVRIRYRLDYAPNQKGSAHINHTGCKVREDKRKYYRNYYAKTHVGLRVKCKA